MQNSYGTPSLGRPISERNYGIDVARLVSMFLVVLLHNLGHGGILDWTFDSKRDIAYAVIENYSIIAVNVFALISGYLSGGKRVKIRHVLSLWGAAVFWSFTTTIIGLARGDFGPEAVVESLFPVLTHEYWYLNSFLILQLFSPLLSSALKTLEQRRVFASAFALLFCVSFLSPKNGLGVNNGYSALWLITLWLVGASIKMLEQQMRELIGTNRLVLAAIFLPLITTALQYHSAVAGNDDPTRWVNYTNPLVTAYSLVVFLLALRLNVRRPSIQNLLKTLSPLAFGVYLIDQSNWFFDVWLTDRFKGILEASLTRGIPLILIISILMYATFLFLEYMRQQLARHIKAS